MPIEAKDPASGNSPSPRVTIVLVAYQSRSVIDNALERLAECHQESWLRCIVVDNASDDGTAAHVAANYPWIHLIENDENVGFGRANNCALPHVRGPYVLFLNPDAAIGRTDLIRMMEFLDAHDRAGIVGPCLAHPDGHPHIAAPMPTIRNVIRQAAGNSPTAYSIPAGSEPRKMEWVSGSALMIRKELLERLQGFDPRFFLYFEEADLCRRAAAHGFETWLLPQARAVHLVGHSTHAGTARLYASCAADHFFQSRFYFFVKHHGWLPAVTGEVSAFLLIAARVAWNRVGRKSVPDDLYSRLRSPVLRLPHAP